MDNDYGEYINKIATEKIKYFCKKKGIKDDEVIIDLIQDMGLKLYERINEWIYLEDELHQKNYLFKIASDIVNDYYKKEIGNPAYYRFIKRIEENLSVANFIQKVSNSSIWYINKKHIENRISRNEKIDLLKEYILKWKEETNFKQMNENIHKSRAKSYIKNKEFITLLIFIGKKIEFYIKPDEIYEALEVIFVDMEKRNNLKSNDSEMPIDENGDKSRFDVLPDDSDNFAYDDIISNQVNEFIANNCKPELLKLYYLKICKENNISEIEKELNIGSSTIYDREKKFRLNLKDFFIAIDIDIDEAEEFLNILNRKLDKLFSIKEVEVEK